LDTPLPQLPPLRAAAMPPAGLRCHDDRLAFSRRYAEAISPVRRFRRRIIGFQLKKPPDISLLAALAGGIQALLLGYAAAAATARLVDMIRRRRQLSLPPRFRCFFTSFALSRQRHSAAAAITLFVDIVTLLAPLFSIDFITATFSHYYYCTLRFSS
jgi:hypothetical protein